eukprot:4887098-Amphidinium_carterae.1
MGASLHYRCPHCSYLQLLRFETSFSAERLLVSAVTIAGAEWKGAGDAPTGTRLKCEHTCCAT